MGKRELVIALAFIVAGALAYEFMAPPPKPGEEGFSMSRFWTNARRGMRGNPFQESVASTGTFRVAAGVTDLRVGGLNRGVRILGESRTDIAYELTAVSNGSDQAAAAELAKQVAIKTDDLGNTMALRVTYPRAGSQWGSLVLRVPSRLTVRIDGSGGAYAGKVANVELGKVTGDVTLVDIAGEITGQASGGDLRVTGAGSVKLTLSRSSATFEHVEKGLTLDVRQGECRIAASSGPIEIDEANAEITVVGHDGVTRVNGSNGRVTLDDPHEEARVDVTRAEVEVQLARSVPLTLLTTDDTLRLLLDPAVKATIDAVAEIGQIQAQDFSWQSETVDHDSHLSHAVGAGGPRVSLRNLRGEIVIRKSK